VVLAARIRQLNQQADAPLNYGIEQRFPLI